MYLKKLLLFKYLRVHDMYRINVYLLKRPVSFKVDQFYTLNVLISEHCSNNKNKIKECLSFLLNATLYFKLLETLDFKKIH